MVATTIGERIRELREAKGWSPYDLAYESCIREQNIRNWESGRKAPSVEFIPALARALGVTPNDLFIQDAPCEQCEADTAAEAIPAAKEQ